MPRLCVSALSGGGGKTLLSLGLTRAFAAQGHTVKPFKKGPDYIDAAWLTMAAGRPATNLDPYMLQPERLKALFAHAMRKTQAQSGAAEVLGMIEGNRGLFDGMDVAGSCSTAELARMLGCPIILSINCTKMTRTAAALVHGMTTFEPGLQFAGVVLNQVGTARHEALLRKVIEEYTDVAVLGALPRLKDNPLPERHMGIASCGDELSPEARAVLDKLGTFLAEHINLDVLITAARAAAIADPWPEQAEPFWTANGATEAVTGTAAEYFSSVEAPKEAPLRDASTPAENSDGTMPDAQAVKSARPPRIAYVRDSALWFYYEENLEALERAGAELVRLEIVGPHSGVWPVLRGDKPQQAEIGTIDGLYLGGGFPEDCAADLSASPHLRTLAAWAGAGLPIYAECGGFMLLSQGIEREGVLWPMSNIFPVIAQFCGKPQGLGYVHGTVVEENPFFPKGLEILGHEFHYSRCCWQGAAPRHGLRLRKGQGMGREAEPDGQEKGETAKLTSAPALDGLLRQNVWASYTHIFAPAVPCWAPNFVAAAARFAQGR
ncbi:cobyrinate a,c-diamide synthase [Desulfovibrio sp. UIB00]|uniref:cobyrinate a,c-diamide synthase n=1 Tax=Desulfovibrio sp. UIB00 TaxID=2804314 RepID=UPI001F0F1799|nr:cobyrinate a,c-diamide synthase [Desulfovibrio sp. UIB00]MCH5145740.1 cobyrinate a,c-diamide synthase [Desulfovibrio sp. UIB00]